MLLELIIALAFGIIIGTITGLLPGIHINLVSVIILSLPISTIVSPIYLVIFITSLSITHIFIDFIPTIFLGCPNEDTSLSVLPGHELLLEGNGYEAIILSITGSLIGIILLIPLTIIFFIFLPTTYNLLKNIMPLVLILIIFTMFFFEKGKKKTLFIIILSGLLGISVLTLNLNIKEPLLPMLTGLFGASSIILSISKKSKIPFQEIKLIKHILRENKSNLKKPILASLIASPICSFLPGLGSNQASTIGSYIFENLNKKQFLILIGIVNSLVMSLSFIILYSINKSRTGSAAYITKLLPNINQNQLFLIIITVLITSVIVFLITIKISKVFSKNIYKINYNLLSIIIILFLSSIILIFSGFIGFFVFLISTFTGISCILLNVRRTSLMACLLIPTIIYYIL
ncbi:tripartite tricarboxylate transporter permease [Candidatus Pacearchaeota archaeon]|nr:tripartite tricarboxylate transporter permease [Candidatus Pacearchaeota archaeon]